MADFRDWEALLIFAVLALIVITAIFLFGLAARGKSTWPPPPPKAPANWHPDPYGIHELRYFDGAAWREYVSDSGFASIDPPPPPPKPEGFGGG